MEAGYPQVEMRPVDPADHTAIEALLDAEIAGRFQARLGEQVDVLEGSGWGLWSGDRCAGVATLAPGGDAGRVEIRILVVAPDVRGRGLSGRLIEALADEAGQRGSTVLWLVTTNDNLDALRVYQRHGFRLTELHPGNVDLAREAKPSIPLVGGYGIPLRDELVLERRL